MLVLGLDFETQGDDAKTTRITEIGAVLYDYSPCSNSWQKVREFSTLCYEPEYPPQTEQIVELTGITDPMLKSDGITRKLALEGLLPLVLEADVVMAHKTYFDKTVLDSTAKLYGIAIPNKFWLCTLTNFPWPKRITCRKLSHIAYEHSILIDPATLHRAVNDVDLMFAVVAKYDFEKVCGYAKIPWVYLRAWPMEPWKDGEIQTNMAKKLDFTWQRVKYDEENYFPKMWVKRVKETELTETLKQFETLPFRVTTIEGIC